MRTCKDCGENKPESEYYGSKNTTTISGCSFYCKKCWKERRRLWVLKNKHKLLPGIRSKMRTRTKRYKKIIQALKIEYGGACVRCGEADKRLVFDHIDKTTKKFNITGAGIWASLKTIREEAAKCQLLCVKCHSAKHQETGEIKKSQHGSRNMYEKYKCRCELCTKAMRELRREIYQRRKATSAELPESNTK